MSSHPIFAGAGLVMSTTLILLGLNGMARPNAHLSALLVPVPVEPQAKKFSHALMRIWGIRNITVGALLGLIWNTGDDKLLAKGLAAGMAVATTDGFVIRSLTGGGASQHWVVPPVLAIVIAGLYGWFD